MTSSSQANPAEQTPGGDLATNLKLVMVGLGEVGEAVLAAALRDPRFLVAACIDPRPDTEARARAIGFTGPVFPDVSELGPGSGVAIVCTASTVRGLAPVACSLTERGYDVVSSCEELIAPGRAPEADTQSIHAAALKAQRSVVGAGVNPGFAMDVLPAVASLVVRELSQVRLLRRVDVSRRRPALQAKVGVGISLADFENGRREGRLGHVGLEGSVAFLASALGLHATIEETVEPVKQNGHDISLGVRHRVKATDAAGIVRIDATLEMYVGAEEVDRIVLDGQPPLTIESPNGISGDEATVSALLNVGAAIAAMPPGLHTLADFLPATGHLATGTP